MSAKVLSLTPPEVLASVHDELAAELAPHSLEWAARDRVDGAALSTADYLIGDWTHQLTLDAPALDRAERRVAIFQPTAGVQSIGVDHAASLGIPVANVPGANARAVAEWTVMAILALLKDVWRHHAGVLAGE